MKRVIIINGAGGVGKDTFCDLCKKFAWVIVRSSVSPIKEIAERVGWDGGKTERDRKFLSDLKDLCTEYNDYPMQYMKKVYDYFMNVQNNREVLFFHIREPLEIQKAVKEFNAVTVLITNKNVPAITTNHADSEVANYPYDFYVNNDGTLEDLEVIAKGFIDFLRAEDETKRKENSNA